MHVLVAVDGGSPELYAKGGAYANKQPTSTGIAHRIEVGCQSFMLSSSVNYDWSKGYNSATLGSYCYYAID